MIDIVWEYRWWIFLIIVMALAFTMTFLALRSRSRIKKLEEDIDRLG